MVKIKHPAQDGGISVKLSGIMPAIIDGCSAEVVTARSGKEYTQLVVDLTLDNETEKSLFKKMFFRLPYDSWDARPGEHKSLFNQFREATGMTSEELSDTQNYPGKKITVLVGPEKRYSGEWNTFEGRDGKILLSFNITKIYSEEIDIVAEEIANAEMIKLARDEIDKASEILDQPGFRDEPTTF